ncbi:hypothetical protein LTR05_004712 [Lithohypha guttulata]|uniref:UspA domain-containing protein n=1 Tax=Lithohypha guttulata TaxID=1690604 RepID=A0AAN7YG82_9EURO|nr:hypothetical protein LTR05_004712 [Lithohypha guttulata]
MARRNSVSIEEVLDEDNKAELAALERTESANSSRKKIANGPRSTASVGSDPLTAVYVGNKLGVRSPTMRHSSIAGEGAGVTSPGQSRKKKLDPSDPSTWTRPVATVSPVEPRPRSASENIQREDLTIQFTSEDEKEGAQAGALTSVEPSTPAMPFRSRLLSSAAYSDDGQSPVEISTATIAPDSPMSTRSDRTDGPLSPSTPQSLAPPSDETARRLSQQSVASTATDDSDVLGPGRRVNMRGEEDVVEEYSESERSDSEDEGSPVSQRGRKRKTERDPESLEPSKEPERTEAVTPLIRVDEADTNDGQPHHTDHSGKLSETQGERITPRSNYQRGASPAAQSALSDEDAELKRAKALELRVSDIEETVKDRTVKMIIRGDWKSFQDYEEEDQTNRHEPRLYLVCTDLSNEATYALEWTVGTLLKDGDSILIVNAVEDENATKAKDFDPNLEPSLEVRLESAKAAEEATSTMDTLTRQTTNQQSDAQYETHKKLKLSALKDHARSLSRTGRNWTKKDEERVKAVDKLENDFLKFVRKTTLQVRCMIEVIHCRNSRHLILSAIDGLEPTLVVVGTRGQGSVKNVLMGSFSNYLVQKSSIPVMVARKRLKKPHHAKISSQQIRMTNNLMPTMIGGKRKSLTQARID